MALIADDPGTTSRLERSGAKSPARGRSRRCTENETGLRALAPPSRRHATRFARALKRSVPGTAGRGAERSGEGSSPLDAAPGPGSRILGGQLDAPEDGPGDSMTSPPPISSFLRAPFALSLLLVVGAAIMPRGQQAHAQLASMRLELGDGLAVERCPRAPTPWEPPQCWQPVGFSFGTYGVLHFARTFARSAPASATRGRIFAAIPLNTSQLGRFHAAPVVYSDDLGAHWQESSWDPQAGAPNLGAFSPLALAIEPGGRRVVAAGEYARLWVSADGGESFTQRRSGGPTYVGVEALGRAIVLLDTEGRAWVTPDDGSSLRPVSSDRGAVLSREPDAIVVRIGRRAFRVDARGDVR